MRPAGIHFGSLQVIRMLTSIDIVGHLAAGLWILDRLICFFPRWSNFNAILLTTCRRMCSKSNTGNRSWQGHVSKLYFNRIGRWQMYAICWLCMFDCHWACGAKRDFLNGAKRGCNETVLKTSLMPNNHFSSFRLQACFKRSIDI